ncbi:MAG: DUF3120 domain-containing protein [Cyanobacteria bacterium J06632_22]
MLSPFPPETLTTDLSLSKTDAAQTAVHVSELPSAALLHFSEPRRAAFGAAAFLVSVPVFFQAPLVRLWPHLSLVLGGVLLLTGWQMMRSPAQRLWGDLTVGFSWTWLAGTLYWGWFRWEPLVHLPMEALALPVVAVLLYLNRAKVGSYFYLGSLTGTVLTDLYFYWTDLIPYWRQLMQVEPAQVGAVLHAACMVLQNSEAVLKGGILLSCLILLGTLPLTRSQAHWWAFAGAVLSTILVDALFLLSAVLA